MTRVRLKPAAPQSQVKQSTTQLPSILFCLFDLILYIPSTNFSYKGTGRPGTKLGLMLFAQGHNTVMPVRLEPVAPRSRVQHSTTESLHSLQYVWENPSEYKG